MRLHEGGGYPASVHSSCTIKVNSRICLKDVDSGDALTFCLVPPEAPFLIYLQIVVLCLRALF